MGESLTSDLPDPGIVPHGVLDPVRYEQAHRALVARIEALGPSVEGLEEDLRRARRLFELELERIAWLSRALQDPAGHRVLLRLDPCSLRDVAAWEGAWADGLYGAFYPEPARIELFPVKARVQWLTPVRRSRIEGGLDDERGLWVWAEYAAGEPLALALQLSLTPGGRLLRLVWSAPQGASAKVVQGSAGASEPQKPPAAEWVIDERAEQAVLHLVAPPVLQEGDRAQAIVLIRNVFSYRAVFSRTARIESRVVRLDGPARQLKLTASALERASGQVTYEVGIEQGGQDRRWLPITPGRPLLLDETPEEVRHFSALDDDYGQPVGEAVFGVRPQRAGRLTEADPASLRIRVGINQWQRYEAQPQTFPDVPNEAWAKTQRWKRLSFVDNTVTTVEIRPRSVMHLSGRVFSDRLRLLAWSYQPDPTLQVDITVNGRPVAQSAQEARRQAMLPLDPGQNRLDVWVTNRTQSVALVVLDDPLVLKFEAFGEGVRIVSEDTLLFEVLYGRLDVAALTTDGDLAFLADLATLRPRIEARYRVRTDSMETTVQLRASLHSDAALPIVLKEAYLEVLP